MDFWTYSCVNCIRTLPYITALDEKYRSKGLVILGIHTPEFAFEKEPENVKTALKQYNINYPVGLDNDYETWNAFNNHYWPAKYLINREGYIVYTHFGEGNYSETENAIRKLLQLDNLGTTEKKILNPVNSPEMHFGLDRVENLTPEQTAPKNAKYFSFPAGSLQKNRFALSGTWKFDQEKITLLKPGGKMKLHFDAGKVYMVAQSPERPIKITITVDGKAIKTFTISEARLYTLYDSGDYKDHTMLIKIEGEGLEAFTFTFG